MKYILIFLSILTFSCEKELEIAILEDVRLTPYSDGSEESCGYLIEYWENNQQKKLHPVEIPDSLLTVSQPYFNKMTIRYLNKEHTCLENHPLIEYTYPREFSTFQVVEILEVEY